MKVIHQGAEAIIYFDGEKVIKERLKKTYRHSKIDDRIRKKTTRFETRLLEKAKNLIPVPKVLSSCDKAMKIEMEFIEGEKIRDIIDNLPSAKRVKLFERIGKKVAKLHGSNIIHGDLTTSNMIVREKIYFIDFGLGFVSTKVEDKAVDLHLLKQALKSKHHEHFEESFEAVMKGYKKESDNYEKLIERFEKVEKRGRYKRKNRVLH